MITVTNRHGRQPAQLATTTRIYVGRGSPLGNPFPITRTTTRDQVIARYEDWLRHQPGDSAAWVEIRRIGAIHGPASNIELQCYCAPKPCHADVIKRIIEEGEY